ncbi:MAG TPA: outer membrane beta-barrel protein, partial [Polyangiaceae bacterium]
MRASKLHSGLVLLCIPAFASVSAAQPAPAPAPAPLPAPAPAPAPAPMVAPAPMQPAPAPMAPAPMAPAPAPASFQMSASSTGGSSSSGGDYWSSNVPTPMALELGVYGGLAAFSGNHDLQNLSDTSDEKLTYGHQRLYPGLDLGARVGFYPLTFVGIEGEFGVIPTRSRTDKQSATIWTYRASVILQYPEYRFVPFLAVGLGGMSLRSHVDSLGNDSDPEMHIGLGAKYALTQDFSLRFDVRDNLMQKDKLLPGVKDGALVSNWEFLLGLSFTLGRTADAGASSSSSAPAAPLGPPDWDHDGVLDSQ